MIFFAHGAVAVLFTFAVFTRAAFVHYNHLCLQIAYLYAVCNTQIMGFILYNLASKALCTNAEVFICDIAQKYIVKAYKV